jgi:hypothetical protein
MSDAGRRVVKMFGALSAVERALLILQAMKEGGEEDPAVRFTMPYEQLREFNHYIFLMNTVNFELGTFLSYLNAMAQQMQIRLGWLQSLKMWSIIASGLAGYITLFCKEPVIQSEYDRLLREARQEMLPVEDAAECATDQYGDWTDADRDEDGDLTRGAWDRVLAEKRRELEALVETGMIVGRRKGKKLLVQTGSFYDWLGEPTPVQPQWGMAYEVFPDEKADFVSFNQGERRHVLEMSERWTPQDLLSAAPQPPESYPDAGGRLPHRNWPRDGLIAALVDGVAKGWRLARAVELVIEEVREEFEGEDPTVPFVRDILAGAKLTLTDVHDRLQSEGIALDLPEPDEEDLAVPRKIIDRAERVYG